MPETVGTAQYELGVSMTKLKSGLADAKGQILSTGAATEKAFAQQGTAAANKMAKSQGVLVRQSAELKKGLLAGVGIGGGLVAFSAMTGVVSGLVGVMTDAVHAAAEEQAQIDQLTRALKENAAAWDGNIDAVEAVITQRQNLAFSDGELRDSLQALITVTKDVDTAFEVQATAMDLARLKNLDLTKASILLGKVYNGNFGALGKMGIALDKGATSTAALAAVQKMAAGQAETYAAKTQGKLVRAQIAADNATEDFGTTLLPVADVLSDLAITTLPLVGKFFADLGPSLRDATIAIPELFTTIGEEAKKLELLIGRDLVNDFFNFTRIVATGGTALVIDSMDDVQRGLQDVGADIGWLSDEAGSLVGPHGGLTTGLLGAADAAGDLADGLEDVAKAEASAIAETRGLGEINKALHRQIALRNEAARENKVGAFFKHQANINELREEKDLRREGVARLREWRRNRGAERKAQEEVTAEVETTGDALTTLGGMKATPQVVIEGAARALTVLGNIQAALAGLGSVPKLNTTDNSGRDTPYRHDRDPSDIVLTPRQRRRQRRGLPIWGATGAVYNPGDWGYVGENAMERIRNVGGVTTVEPIAGGRRGGGTTVVNISINAGAYLGTPLDAQRHAQYLAPAIGRELSRIGLN